MKSRTIQAAFVVIAILNGFVFAPATAEAVTILPGLYKLHNHPDGAVDPPPYGMRLDEIYNVSGGLDIFTFDFDHPDSAMTLVYDDVNQTITIDGVAYGGRDIGGSYANDGYLGTYDIHFVYDMNVGVVPGDDDLWCTSPNHTNTGTILTPLNDSFNLSDVSSGSYTFRFGDENNDLGHRGFDGISGWGWLALNGTRYSQGADDWLFTAEYIIPEPSAIAFLAIGLVAMNIHRLRKR